MKRFFYLISMILIVLGCDQTSNTKDRQEQTKPVTDPGKEVKTDQPQSAAYPAGLFTKSDAEKILGEPAHLTESSVVMEVDTFEYKCAYVANAKDPKTGKTGSIYFMLEEYGRLSAAKDAYSSIRRANESHEGVKVLHDMGDEAYFHSDGENFYFILVRKGPKMVRMKVNKTTSTTSVDEFMLIAKNITAAL
jgi:hypothetical protein